MTFTATEALTAFSQTQGQVESDQAKGDIAAVELAIDGSFASNPLVHLSYAQAAWTLLSVVEDRHLKNTVTARLPNDQVVIFMDTTINALTYPLRVCFRESLRSAALLDRKLDDQHYTFAEKWLDDAEDYGNFSSIFPLFHAGEIEISVDSKNLSANGWEVSDFSAEAYNRLMGKRDPATENNLDPNRATREILACLTVSGPVFNVQFSRKLLEQITKAFEASFNQRHTLPAGWRFSQFDLAEYRLVVSCLQCMTYTWFVARQLALDMGATALAYSSSVWVPRKSVLTSLIARHTGVERRTVEMVLRYLTFGEMGVRNPDVAIQPILELSEDTFAISPFLLIHINAERNLCVLLNQIPKEKDIYSRLVDQKENLLKQRVIADLDGLGLEFRYGKLSETDIDLAIVEHASQTCLCIELKWFIEPAEIREMLVRSEELSKGVMQCQKITEAFRHKDSRLLDLLQINCSYDFLAIVGSENFIGRPQTQCGDVAIIKVWHLVSEIRSRGGLKPCLQWLKDREYLPKRGVDFDIHKVPLQCGEWTSEWYGIGPAEAGSTA